MRRLLSFLTWSSRTRAGRLVPLRVRATIAFGLTALLLSLSLAALAYGLVRDFLLDERRDNALREAFANGRVLRGALAEPQADIPQLLAGLTTGTSSEAALHFRGRWFATAVGAGRDLVPPSLRHTVDGGHAGVQRTRRDGEPVMVVGVPVRAVEAAYYEVSPLGDVEATLSLLLRALGIAGVVATVIGATVGAVASRSVLQPVHQIAEVARDIVDGELDRRLDAAGDPDLGPLVGSFNEMLDELRDRIHRESRFASDVTHELRAPLAALASAVAVVHRRRDELPATVVDAVDALDRQVQSFNRLVLDLLEISRFDAATARLEPEELELDTFLRVTLDDRHLTRVPIRYEVPGSLRLRADRRRLQQVVSNLLDNAELYAGGVVAVAVAAADEVVRFAVEDAGPGVPEDEREAIFERFARGSLSEAAEAPRGTGLGLALVREHVRLHGGRVWVEDRPGGGSRFVVEMPRST